MVADTQALVRHLTPDKRVFAGYIGDVLGDPDEIYLSFVKSAVTGRVVLRLRVIRAIDAKGRVMMVVMDAQRGELISYTLFPRDNLTGINRLRSGKLIFGKVPDGA